jgi:thiamine-monophosphate kinase
LSDIAAMGAEPRFCLVSIALTERCDQRWIDGFYRGLMRLAARTGTVLAGGDLSHARQVCCDIVVCGAVPKNRALLRSGARAGDLIYVSGALGAAAAALAKGRARLAEPRLALGRWLRGKATAAMDLSDGLSTDLQRMCAASGVAAEISGEVPVVRGATMEQALHGGEDYELLFTMPPRRIAPEGTTQIGVMIKGKPGKVRLHGMPLRSGGYDHFQT